MNTRQSDDSASRFMRKSSRRTLIKAAAAGALAALIPLNRVQLNFAAAEYAIANEFRRTWERTDKPVADGNVNRTWMWGPQPNTEPFYEPYLEAPGGERRVQYFDKSRMEDNAFRASPPWDVTNGLLATELITGRMQVGDETFEDRSPANVQVAGDDHPDSPTYAMLNPLRTEPAKSERQTITERLNADGSISTESSLGQYGVTAGYYVPDTGHTVASVFWQFMNSSGTVYEDGQLGSAPLFENAFFATGFPITEAFWVYVPVGGVHKWVLLQAFQRRCLTYTPDNPEGWRVEAGNIGQHYYRWRHEEVEEPGTCPDSGPGIYIYVTDTMNSRVQKFDPGGNYICEIGSAGIHPGQFGNSYEVTVDSQGNVYVLAGLVHKFDRYGRFVHRWGDEGDTSGLGASFSTGHGIACDSNDHIYVSEMGAHRIQKFTAHGQHLLTWGSSGEGHGQFRYPIGIAFDDEDNVYVVDSHNRRVQVFSPSGQYIRSIDGTGHFGVNTRDAAINSHGLLHVSDAGGRIHRMSLTGQFSSPLDIDLIPDLDGAAFSPSGIAFDSDGTLYAFNNIRSRIERFSGATHTGYWGGETGTGPGQFRRVGIISGIATWTQH